ncbi:MAG: 2-C-methyl-D-erythritol 4-phosphate cytidylyltransferase [Syntrophomonadaceae bacterium]|jgi:2-C-methyl-D-erythritol 4-phosphate cytidylyltransferase
MANNLGVVIAAAGTGTRMKSKINKPYMLLNEYPVLNYSLDIFEQYKAVNEIIIVVHPYEITYCQQEIVKKFGYRKVKQVVPGGKERQDSIWAGLQLLDKETGYVAVHDGARPLLTVALLNELLEKAMEWGAAIPGVYSRDSLKMVDNKGFVGKTLDRSKVVLIQTPQIFRYTELVKAYVRARAAGFQSTDDSALFEKYIGKVKIVPGDHHNIKITFPEDLIIAQSLLNIRSKG